MTHPMDDTYDEDEDEEHPFHPVYDDTDDRDREEDRWECIGADCLNPHFFHLRDECLTEETAKAWHEEMSKTEAN